jgi:Domain of unknown function (DUF4340)
MRKSWITLGLLFACVAALGVFVWLKPPKTQNATQAVSALKPADARTLRVQRKGQLLAALEKRSSEWFLTEPLAGPADAFQVSRLLAVLEAKSSQQYSSADLAKFELASPQAEITINDQRFAFGAINNVTREQYVLTGNQIYPLELRFAAAIPNDSAALFRRSVLAPGDKPARFEFGNFSVTFDDIKWITTPAAGDVSQDDYNRWVAQWREGGALRAEPSDRRTVSKTIHIVLADGRKVSLGIVQTEPELIIRRGDLGLQFVFVGNVGARMLAMPSASK